MTTGETGMNAADELIRQQVKDKLHEDPKLDEKKIEVQVINGVVHLKGKADTETEKERAAKLAAEVSGVIKVENHLHTSFGIAHAITVIATEMTAAITDIKEEKKVSEEKTNDSDKPNT